MLIDSQDAAKPLTRQQGRILDYIRMRIRQDGMSPTHDEIMLELGLKSAFGVRQHLRLIKDKGYIDLYPRKARGIRLTQESANERKGLIEIPVVGRIAAGRPILAEEHLEDMIKVDDDIFPRGVLFALRVRGDSMIKAGIRSGDLAVIRQQAVVENGEIAAVLIGDEATLKRFCIHEGRICLKAENDDVVDIPIDYRLGVEVGVLGLYVGLIRQAR